jgi:peptidoglycan/LPS O-acetylase OafA/YrhL
MYFVVLFVDLFFHGFFDNWQGWTIPYGLKVALASYLPLVQSWNYEVMGDNTLTFVFPPAVQVTWSISTEWFFYFCYPFVCIGLVRLRTVAAITAAIVAVIVVGYSSIHLAAVTLPTVEAYGVEKYGNIAAAGSPGSFVFWLYYLSPYPRLLEFILGALTAALYMAVRDTPVSRSEAVAGRLVLVAAIVAIAVVYLALFTPTSWLADLPVFADANIMTFYFTFAPFMAALLFCCARYPSWVAATLSRPWIVLCGEASYSIYLIHQMVIEHAEKFNQLATPPLLLKHDVAEVLVTMLIVVSVSLVTYRIIEVPARRALRRLLTLRTTALKPPVDVPQQAFAAAEVNAFFGAPLPGRARRPTPAFYGGRRLSLNFVEQT